MDLVYDIDWSGWAVFDQSSHDEYGNPIVMIEWDNNDPTPTRAEVREQLVENGIMNVDDQNEIIAFLEKEGTLPVTPEVLEGGE